MKIKNAVSKFMMLNIQFATFKKTKSLKLRFQTLKLPAQSQNSLYSLNLYYNTTHDILSVCAVQLKRKLFTQDVQRHKVEILISKYTSTFQLMILFLICCSFN